MDKPSTLIGKTTFLVEFKDNKWQVTGVKPVLIESDSLNNKITIDSVKVETPSTQYPTLKLDRYITIGDTWDYAFKVDDSVTVTLWEHNQVTWAWAILGRPANDGGSPFMPDTFPEPNYWQGTWVPKSTRKQWTWISVIDLWNIWDHDSKAVLLQSVACPYKVE